MDKLIDYLYLVLNNGPLPVVSLTVEDDALLVQLRDGSKFEISIHPTDKTI